MIILALYAKGDTLIGIKDYFAALPGLHSPKGILKLTQFHFMSDNRAYIQTSSAQESRSFIPGGKNLPACNSLKGNAFKNNFIRYIQADFILWNPRQCHLPAILDGFHPSCRRCSLPLISITASTPSPWVASSTSCRRFWFKGLMTADAPIFCAIFSR